MFSFFCSDLCQKYIVNSSQNGDIAAQAQTASMQFAPYTSASSEEYEGEEIATLYEDRESHRNHDAEAVNVNLTKEKCRDGVDGFGGECGKNLNLSVEEQVDFISFL